MIDRMHLAALAALFSLASAASAQESYSAKSLFFGTSGDVVAVSTSTPDPAVAQAKTKPPIKKTQVAAAPRHASNGPIGARYFIRLLAADGQGTEVPTSRLFRSGEKFQVGVEVNGPTYIYVWNEESSGRKVQLFPVAGQDNFVNVKGRVTVPSRGSFEFDQVPGEERMTILLTRQRLDQGDAQRVAARPDFVQAPVRLQDVADRCGNSAAPMQVAMADSIAVSKGIVMRDSALDAPGCAPAQAYAAKGIVFSEDAATDFRPASYVVKTDPGSSDTLTLQIRLQHQ